MVNYFNPTSNFLGTFERKNFHPAIFHRILCLTQKHFSWLSRCRWLHGALPRLRVCRWDSVQRYRTRLPRLHFDESCRDKGQIWWHEVVDLLGKFEGSLSLSRGFMSFYGLQVIFATFSVIEFFSLYITKVIPFYWLLKCVFFIWCMAPIENNGSVVMYYKVIRPYFLKHQNGKDRLFWGLYTYDVLWPALSGFHGTLMAPMVP